VNQIGKDKKADPKMGGYAFRGIDQVMDAVGVAMREVGLVMETHVLDRDYQVDQGRNSEGKTILWTSCRLTVRYTFVDPVDGSRHSFEMAGEARATDDKATSKAEAMALKYGVLQALMVPVEGMPDGDGESPQVLRDEQRAAQEPPASPPVAPPQQGQQQPSQMELARRALAALRALDRTPADRRQVELARIRTKIEAEGLGGVEVDGATLRAHGVAVAQTLPAQPAGQPAAEAEGF
jgi:hypothetical protein